MGYIDSVLTGSKISICVDRLYRRIEETIGFDSFSSIAFRGMSGALVAGPLALRLDKNLILIRKKEENSHSFGSIDGDWYGSQPYIIVDDFIETGATILEILNTVNKVGDTMGLIRECLGIFLYYTPIQAAYKLNQKMYLEEISPYKDINVYLVGE